MQYFPLFLDLRGRAVTVVGGGIVAERKITLLRPAGPHITVVAPQVTAALRARAAAGEITHIPEVYSRHCLDGQRLVIAATDQRATNWQVAADADAMGILVNVVDDIEPSNCIVPAIVDRSPLVIAVSTAGCAPVLARDVRTRIEQLIDESFGRLAGLLQAARASIKARLPDTLARRRFYEQLLAGPLPDLIRQNRHRDAHAMLAQSLESDHPAQGRVILVGAGPGDPGLLTLKAVRALQSADVVLYDRLVAPEILAYARREALCVEVGKSACGRSTPQHSINAQLVQHAASGATVVRLKGGDPFVFGRGGEELEYLRAHSVPFEVVPGVTAATACAAYAGIPLTHRDFASSARLATGHRRESVGTAAAMSDYSRADETLVVYMGVGMLGDLQERLLAAGRAPDTPIAFIENGTRPNQRVLRGMLRDAQDIADKHRLRAPSLIIIGAVAALAESLHWFGDPPLASTPARSVDPVIKLGPELQVA